MIVITARGDGVFGLREGDRATLELNNDSADARYSSARYEFEVTEGMDITQQLTYRFALEDGTCVMPFVYVIAGNTSNLPKEILEAPYFEDLPREKRDRFVRSYQEWCSQHTQPEQQRPFALDVPLRSQPSVYAQAG